MARPAEPGRQALLDAGVRILARAETPELARLSANSVVAEAAMSKGAFFHHFPTRNDYVLALHRRFHDAVAAEVLNLLATLPPGSQRIRAGITTYLDFCLRHAETKALLFDARADTDLAAVVTATNRRFATLMEPDLAALGWSDTRRVADLVVAAAAEVALIEADCGRRSAAHRRALWQLVVGPSATGS